MPGYKKENGQDKDDTEGKLFVGGIGWESTEETVKEYFETFGSVAYVKLKRNREDPSKHRGFAFVKFVNPTDSDKVLASDQPHLVDGVKIDPKSACPLGVKPEERTKKIFVGGLQAETTDERLMEYFKQYGEIIGKIEFATDRNTKKRRGFCFIEFANEGIVDRIVKTKFHEVAGKRLETKRALSKQQQQELAALSAQQHVRGLAGQLGDPILHHPGHMTHYGHQPVIYIHPDSITGQYPFMGMGSTPLPGGYTTSTFETLYMPYNAQQAQNNRFAFNAGNRRFQPSFPRYPSKPS